MVFLLIGIVLVVATPAFTSCRRSLDRRSAVGQLITDLRAARQLAVTRRTPVIVAFGNGSATTNIATYKMHADKDGDRVVDSGELVLNNKLPRNTVLSRVTLVPTDTLLYDISGLLRTGTTGGLLIVQVGSRYDTLHVAVSGQVYEL